MIRTRRQLIEIWLIEQAESRISIEDFYLDCMDYEERALFASIEDFEQAIEDHQRPN